MNELLTSVDDFVKTASRVGTIRNLQKVVADTLARKPWILPALAGAGGAGVGIGAGMSLSGQTPMMTEDAVSEELGTGHGMWPGDPSKILETGKAFLKAAPWVIGAGALTGLGSELGKGLATAVGGGTKRLFQSAYTGLTPNYLEELMAEDPIIAEADPAVLQEAMSTIERFAPSLAADKPSVRAFLREAATTGSGINYNTVKLLAEAERAVQTAGGGF
jgi:hypothetical protein